MIADGQLVSVPLICIEIAAINSIYGTQIFFLNSAASALTNPLFCDRSDHHRARVRAGKAAPGFIWHGKWRNEASNTSRSDKTWCTLSLGSLLILDKVLHEKAEASLVWNVNVIWARKNERQILLKWKYFWFKNWVFFNSVRHHSTWVLVGHQYCHEDRRLTIATKERIASWWWNFYHFAQSKTPMLNCK